MKRDAWEKMKDPLTKVSTGEKEEKNESQFLGDRRNKDLQKETFGRNGPLSKTVGKGKG